MLKTVHFGRTIAGCKNVLQQVGGRRPFGTNPKTKLRRVLVVSKLTRLEFEKNRDQSATSLSDAKLEQKNPRPRLGLRRHEVLPPPAQGRRGGCDPVLSGAGH
uniref:(northern house mosquito) hypothetical protein n=1 Tax=Culex pipiens TaxID=7175 RepID=A0A8D8HVD5_CULPI